MEGTQQYLEYVSLPNYVEGYCRPCKASVPLDNTVRFDDNSPITCGVCSTISRRRDLIQSALATVNAVTWSLFGSDMYIGDQLKMQPGESAVYDLGSVKVAKWQHHEVYVDPNPNARYLAEVNFTDSAAFFTVRDTQLVATGQTVEAVEGSWYRFGLSEIGAVPAWRQSLFGAATLVKDFPSAAAVLIAAGFESFFLETMRIGWKENGLDPEAFKRLVRNTAISSLVGWLGPAVHRPSLQDAPDNLHQSWQDLVNRRRNDVVHRADVNLSSEDVMESMRIALECICFIDESALVRLHAYYRPL